MCRRRNHSFEQLINVHRIKQRALEYFVSGTLERHVQELAQFPLQSSSENEDAAMSVSLHLMVLSVHPTFSSEARLGPGDSQLSQISLLHATMDLLATPPPKNPSNCSMVANCPT